MPEIGQLPGNGAAWGNIYNTNMPQTDEAANQAASLQGQQLLQQQRELQAQKAAKLKDAQDQQDKINANVRGADVPLVNQKYNDFREASMDLEANKKKLPREVYLDRQQQVNQKLADVTKLIADSTQGKAQDAEDIKNQSDPSKSFDYNDNAHNILNQRVNTPINQWSAAPVLDANGKQVMDENGKPKTQDLSDPSLVKYKAKEDFSPLIQTAVGKSEKLNGGIPIGNQGGINRTTKDYTGSNSAYGIANTLSTSLQSDDKKGGLKAVERQADILQQSGNVSDADMAATDKQYNESYLTNPDVKAAYGLTGKETFPNTGNPKIDKLVKYIAQKQAMLPDNMPKAETKVVANAAVKDASDHAFDLQKIKYAHDLKQGDDKGATTGIDDSWNELYKGTGTGVTTKIANPQGTGGTTDEHRDIISAPLDFRKAFTVEATNKDGKVTKLVPDAIVKRPNGNLVGIYYQRDADGNVSKSDNGNIPSRTDITPVELDPTTAKAAYAKAIGGTKAVDALSKKQTTEKQYKLNNKTFSQSDIEKGAKKYGMTVDQYIKQTGLQ